MGQGQGVSSIPLDQTNLRDFHRVARKYGIDYAITKDNSRQPLRYIVFFKARDADALNAAFREFMVKKLGKRRAASVLGELEQEKSRVKPDKTREKIWSGACKCFSPGKQEVFMTRNTPIRMIALLLLLAVLLGMLPAVFAADMEDSAATESVLDSSEVDAESVSSIDADLVEENRAFGSCPRGG